MSSQINSNSNGFLSFTPFQCQLFFSTPFHLKIWITLVSPWGFSGNSNGLLPIGGSFDSPLRMPDPDGPSVKLFALLRGFSLMFPHKVWGIHQQEYLANTTGIEPRVIELVPDMFFVFNSFNQTWRDLPSLFFFWWSSWYNIPRLQKCCIQTQWVCWSQTQKWRSKRRVFCMVSLKSVLSTILSTQCIDKVHHVFTFGRIQFSLSKFKIIMLPCWNPSLMIVMVKWRFPKIGVPLVIIHF